MFRRVLVPLGGATTDSTRERSALELARRLAEREGARLVLLHVDRASAAGATDETEIGRTQMATHGAVINHAAELRRIGVPVSVHFASGAPDQSIASTAREEHADLIVLAPHQRPLLRTLLQPGVTNHLMRRAPAPLLILPERLHGMRDAAAESALDATLADGTAAPVIVPLDGGHEAERALPLAAAFAWAHRRTLLLVTVVAPLPAIVGMEMAYPAVALPTAADLPEDRLRESLRYLGGVRRELRAHSPDLAVQTTGRIGEVAPVVADLAAAHPGSIVVMTTHGRGRALRLLLGSVAMELLSLTPAPLLIVPPRRRTLRRIDDTRVRVEAAGATAVMDAADTDAGRLESPPDALGPRPTF